MDKHGKINFKLKETWKSELTKIEKHQKDLNKHKGTRMGKDG